MDTHAAGRGRGPAANSFEESPMRDEAAHPTKPFLIFAEE